MNSLAMLRGNIKSESEAYGYTLAVWGSGAMLLQSFDILAIDVVAFVLGGVIGFGVLAALAFKDVLERVNLDQDVDLVAGSMIHILASLGTVLISYFLIHNIGRGLELELLSLVIGVNTTFTYNILLLVEEYLTDDVHRMERE